MRFIGTLIVLVISTCVAHAQPGNILEQGDQVLDPNQDGFISFDNTGFSSDGYDVDEFELKMFGIPIFGDGEALNDVQSGQPCGVVDLALDTAGYALYAGYDTNENLIFRFRLAGDKKSVQSYSILIDTDQLVGAADPNSNAINPGFEIEITLIQKFGVYIYAIDGIDSCPTPIRAYNVETHQQKATSSQESCDDPDIYIDFYVPFSDLTDLFGITPNTNVRFAGVTNISATCALDGSISDIGGVDDVAYDGCFSCAILDLTENQCPSSVSNLCDTCAGFPLGATETPEINLPVLVGDTNISGTSEPEAEIYIALFSSIGTLLDRDTTQSDEFGDWISNEFVIPLSYGDSVVVNALLPGKCQSGLSDTGLSFAIVSPNQPPQITGNTQTISYQENDPPVIITDSLVINDDNELLTSATVSIISNYEEGYDILEANPPPGIEAVFTAADGMIIFTGTASIADYDSALSSVTFHSLSEAPSLEIRTASYQVNDGTNLSPSFNKNILIIGKNDAPVIVIGSTPVDTIAVSTDEDTPLVVTIDAIDIDLDSTYIDAYTIAGSDSYVDVIDGTSLLFTPAINYYGHEYIHITVCDDGTPTLCDSVVVDIDVLPVNDAPFVLDDGVITDSLSFKVELGDSLEFCLVAEDIENHDLIIESINMLSSTSSEVNWQSGLCFTYEPQLGYVGYDEAEVTICDTGVPARCTMVYINFEVIDTNNPPQITTSTQDTIYFEIFENNSLEVCLEAIDPDDDPLDFGSVTDLLGVGGNIESTYPCINYTPIENFVGNVLIESSVCDDVIPAKCDEIIISIDVLPFNNPPEVVVENEPVDTLLFTTKKNETLEFCLDVTDPDNDNVTTTDATTVIGEGTFVVDGSLCVTFIPGVDEVGDVWGTVTICDDGDPSSECVETVIGVTVTPVNIPPSIVLAGEDIDTLYFETDENTILDLCIDVVDPDSDSLYLTSIHELQGGGFYYPGDSEFCLNFIPNEDYVGDVLHLISVCDNGTPLGCDSVYVNVTVHNVNQPPELIFGGVPVDTIRVTTNENEDIEICAVTSDIDGDNVFVNEAVIKSGEGSISFTESGSDVCFNYSPNLDYFGTTYAGITICDTGTPSECEIIILEIDVLNVNNAPVIYQSGMATDTIRISTPGRSMVTQCIDAIDLDGDSLILSFTSPGIENGIIQEGTSPLCIDYTPDNNFLGFDYFTVTVCDNYDPALCDEVVVEVEVYSTNQPPVISFDGVPADTVSINAFEKELILLSFSVDDDPGDQLSLVNHGVIDGQGELMVSFEQLAVTLDYTPDVLSNGIHKIQFNICDNGLPVLCDSLTLLVDVDPLAVFPYEAISPNDDSLNDFWVIDGIEHYPDNIVHIFDRWNNLVFEIEGYNNSDNVWKGEANRGLIKSDLDDGTYYYKLTLAPGGDVLSGMIILKR
ncbi:MAG: Ig-like domain-containing protein [Bacteroidota bacterium]